MDFVNQAMRILGAADRLYHASDRQDFANAAIAIAEETFPGATIAFHDVSARPKTKSQHLCRDTRANPAVREAWERHALNSPVVRYYFSGGTDPVVETQDLISDVVLRQSALYAECWKPFGATHQVGLRLWSHNQLLGVSIKRDARFHPGEMRTIRAIYPFFARAYRELIGKEVARSTANMFLLNEELRIAGCSPNLRQMPSKRGISHLRDKIRSYFRSTARLNSQRQILIFAFDGLNWRVERICGGLYRIKITAVNPSAHAINALTPRELEILSWVAKGKRNAEIGIILGISWRTVDTHLVHVFEKLGVETRSAAVAAIQGDRFIPIDRDA
jgi:DNA-binding CsgD family transcriptional regulator